MYRRDAGCGCTAPAPVDCKVPHGTGAWLCVCHRLSGPTVTAPGKSLAALGTSKYFLEPNRCLSTDWVFRCARPIGHPGDHRTGRTFWGRRAEDEQPCAHGPGVIAYRSTDGRILRCLQHAPDPSLSVELAPVTSEDLPDGGICTCLDCGVDVLIPQPVAALPADSGRADVEHVRAIARRLAAHAAGFQDVLDDSDRGPWGKTVGADITALCAALDEMAAR
jgi:hypothetical protein